MKREESTPESDFSPTLAGKASDALMGSQEQIVRKWLLAVINDLGMDSLKSFPSRDLVTALPLLISCAADCISHPSGPISVSSEIDRVAATVAELRKEGFSVSKLVDDYALLKNLLLEAAAKNLRSADREALSLFLRLDGYFAQFFKQSLDAYVEAHSAQLERMANSDSLTSLFNMRYFRAQLEENLEMYRRYLVPFSLLMLDVDKLKQLNDTEGHPAGDRALIHLAETMLSEKRSTDIAVRYGGDEFFLIMPGVRAVGEAESLARRIRNRVNDISVRTKGREMTSVSIGIVSCPEDGTDMERLISRSDKALYKAKTAGNGHIARFGSDTNLVDLE